MTTKNTHVCPPLLQFVVLGPRCLLRWGRLVGQSSDTCQSTHTQPHTCGLTHTNLALARGCDVTTRSRRHPFSVSLIMYTPVADVRPILQTAFRIHDDTTERAYMHVNMFGFRDRCTIPTAGYSFALADRRCEICLTTPTTPSPCGTLYVLGLVGGAPDG